MARMVVAVSMLLLIVQAFGLVEGNYGGNFLGGGWGQAHATYYGGADASGTQGGQLRCVITLGIYEGRVMSRVMAEMSMLVVLFM